MVTQSSNIDLVLRALADSTRRAVFERIVRADEITVVELTRQSREIVVEEVFPHPSRLGRIEVSYRLGVQHDLRDQRMI